MKSVGRALEIADRLLGAVGVDSRSFRALARTFVLLDLRSQHYARATATKPYHRMSPLFWVVGQYVTLSAVTSLLLFARVDVFFFAFAGISVSMVGVAASLVVEFSEVVLDPSDLWRIGHRPVSPRTYAAARLANLMFYVLLIGIALGIFPLILGAGLRDAGIWYAPAYFVAAGAASVLTACGVILVLSVGGGSRRLAALKDALAWVQIILILVVGYGGQFMFRDADHALELWAAFPPDWIHTLPPTWLARFVERAAVAPDAGAVGVAAGLLALVVLATVATVQRLMSQYRRLEPHSAASPRRPMAPSRVGSVESRLFGWALRRTEERVGFWLACRALARDNAVKMACLMPLNMPIAVVILAICLGQLENPLESAELRLVTLPVLAVYLVVLAVPWMIYNLHHSRDHAASWLLVTSPLESALGVWIGCAKAVFIWLVTPVAVVLGVVFSVCWGDPVSGGLHALLAWSVSWPVALSAARFLTIGPPLSLPHTRGAAMGPIVVPLAAYSAGLLALVGLHVAYAASPVFWVVMAVATIAATALLAKSGRGVS